MLNLKKEKSKYPDLFKYIIKFILSSRFLGNPEKEDLTKRLGINKYYYKINNIYEYLMTEKEFNKAYSFQNEDINKVDGIKVLVQEPLSQ